MLAGDPPFSGSSGRVILARHSLDPVPSLLTARPSLPIDVENMVMKALRKVPADRYATAADFVDALDDLLVTGGPTRTSSATSKLVRRRRRLPAAPTLTALTALTGAAIWLGSTAINRHNEKAAPQLDTTRYAVLPIEQTGVAASTLDADQLMRDALGRWGGIAVVDRFATRDRLGMARRSLSSGDAGDVAASLNAGRYIRGELIREPDGSLRLHAGLYSTRSNALLSDPTIRSGGRSLDSMFAAMAERLLVPRAPDGFRGEVASGSQSVPARGAFNRGLAAVQRWDLPAADSAFAAAVASDAGYSAALLWLALGRSWSQRPVAEWRSAAERALAGRDRLPAGDDAIAEALVARAAGDMGRACPSWQRLSALRPEEFVTWYGYADCLHEDSEVVRDPRSATGWSFRTSYQASLDAYQHAFRLLPSTLGGLQDGSFESLRRLFITSGSQLRPGRAAGRKRRQFAAYPTWRGDSLAYQPLDLIDVMTSRAGTLPDPALRAAAIRHQRSVLYDVAKSWTAAFPRSSSALEALAVSLQLLGDPSALDTLIRARMLAGSRGQRLRLGATEVFMRLRRALPDDTAQVLRARHLADSLLADSLGLGPEAARLLLPLAALTGRAALAEHLARAPGSSPSYTAKPLTGRAMPMLMLSALGGPVDRLSALAVDVGDVIGREVAAEEQEQQRMMWLARAATLAFPTYRFPRLAALAGHGDPLIDVIAAFARGDTAETRRLLVVAGRTHEGTAPFDLGLDGLFPEAWVLMATGDYADAARRLDPTLQALRQASPELVDDPVSAATLVRAMALRSAIARAAADERSAARWAAPVAILWANADRSLQAATLDPKPHSP
jgi:tetratricopeptide (TPR) repeat protein